MIYTSTTDVSIIDVYIELVKIVENIANKFERAMKKGFVNIFTLMVIGDKPTHGYQIKKLIEERTLGVWTPSDSTMYTILKDLRDKNLIKPIESQDSDDPRIIYELTKKGRETLDIMIQKEQEMRESMRSILFSSSGAIQDLFDEEIDSIPSESLKIGPPFPPFSPSQAHGFRPLFGGFRKDFLGRLDDKPKNEQLRILNYQKKFITQIIENLTKRLENIDEKISELESE